MTARRPRRARLAEALGVVGHDGADAWREYLARDGMDGCLLIRAHGAGFVSDDYVRLTGRPFDERRLRWRIADAREAWAALATAGLLSAEDADSPRRSFVCDECDGAGRTRAITDLPEASVRGVRELRRRLVRWNVGDGGEVHRVALHPDDLAAIERDPEIAEVAVQLGLGEIQVDGVRLVPDASRAPGAARVLDATSLPCHRCEGACALPHPPTVAACVALVADWPGVLAAEAIAHEMRGAPERVVWKVADASERSEHDEHTPVEAHGDAARAALAALGYAIGSDGERSAPTLLAPSP